MIRPKSILKGLYRIGVADAGRQPTEVIDRVVDGLMKELAGDKSHDSNDGDSRDRQANS